MQTKRKKNFDCVEMKNKAAEPINRALMGLTIEEQLIYWKKQAAKFHKSIKNLDKKTIA